MANISNINNVVSNNTLKHYDAKIKQWVSDKISEIPGITGIITVSDIDVIITPTEWDDASHTVVKDIGIDAKNDIIVSAPTNDSTNIQNIHDCGILVKQHTGTKITIEWLYAKPITNVILHITSYS